MENPLTGEEIYQKYRKLATTVTSPTHAEKIAEQVRRIDRLPDLTSLAALLRTLKRTPARHPALPSRRRKSVA